MSSRWLDYQKARGAFALTLAIVVGSCALVSWIGTAINVMIAALMLAIVWIPAFLVCNRYVGRKLRRR